MACRMLRSVAEVLVASCDVVQFVQAAILRGTRTRVSATHLGHQRGQPGCGRVARWLAIIAVLCNPIVGRAELKIVGVTSAVTFEAGLPNWGGIASIFLTGAEVRGIVLAESAPLPLNLAGASVMIGGVYAPIYGVAAGDGYQQINVQVPYEARFDALMPNGIYGGEVVVEQNGQRDSARAYRRSWLESEFFPLPGTFYGILQHGGSYALITRDSPARPGETVIIYMAGLPQTDPAVPTGSPAPFKPLAVLRDREVTYANDYYWLTVGDQKVKPLFIGQTPGAVGLYQVNFVVPDSLPDGDSDIVFYSAHCWRWHGTPCYPGTIDTSYHSNGVFVPVRR